jgi:hypothetical protein
VIAAWQPPAGVRMWRIAYVAHSGAAAVFGIVGLERRIPADWSGGTAFSNGKRPVLEVVAL